jgi:hypothetical protein
MMRVGGSDVNCRRCYYTIGATETRCVNCGAQPGRARLSIVAIMALTCGLGIGWSLTQLMATDVPPGVTSVRQHRVAHVARAR